MALEELLRQREAEERQTSDRAEARDRGSLIRQAGETFSLGETDPVLPEDADEAPERVVYADVYVRRGPVQRRLEAPDYRKKRIRKAVIAAAVILLAALLATALLKSGMIHI